MGSTPIIGTSENAILLGNFVRRRDFVIANDHAWTRTKIPFIRQVFVNWIANGTKIQRREDEICLTRHYSAANGFL